MQVVPKELATTSTVYLPMVVRFLLVASSFGTTIGRYTVLVHAAASYRKDNGPLLSPGALTTYAGHGLTFTQKRRA